MVAVITQIYISFASNIYVDLLRSTELPSAVMDFELVGYECSNINKRRVEM